MITYGMNTGGNFQLEILGATEIDTGQSKEDLQLKTLKEIDENTETTNKILNSKEQLVKLSFYVSIITLIIILIRK